VPVEPKAQLPKEKPQDAKKEPKKPVAKTPLSTSRFEDSTVLYIVYFSGNLR
jgi:hypothetical protein